MKVNEFTTTKKRYKLKKVRESPVPHNILQYFTNTDSALVVHSPVYPPQYYPEWITNTYGTE
jgi:hypothetical protein